MTALPPPGFRLAYDVGYPVVYGSTGAALSAGDLQTLNDESDSGVGPLTDNIVFLQPANVFDQYAVVAVYLNTDGAAGTATLSSSLDTTDGTDGTWTAHALIANNAGATVADTYRHAWTLMGLGSVAGFRLEFPVALTVRAIHLYVTDSVYPAGGDGSENVAFSGLGLMAQGLDDNTDFGPTQQDSTDVDTVTVTNNSPLTAHAVVVSVETPLTDATVGLVEQIYLSADDGATWHGELALGDLVTQAQHDILIRRFTRHDADLGDWALRLLVDATGGYS